ncbi:MAG: hypothetical protein NC392_01005 [Roseburia sp.]|nr:hypothetical protein [Roseburia sp.]
MLNRLKNFVKVRTRDVQWVICYRKKDKNALLYDGSYDNKFTTIRPTIRYWFADPIINEIEGEEYLFCEMYDVIKKKGAIGISYKKKNGEWSKPKKILGGGKADEHLSFPVVIKWKGDYYMFPCIGNGIIQVYKMGKNECEWNLWCELFDDHYYVDTIFINIDEHLYMISGAKDKNNPLKTKLSINEILDLEIKDKMVITSAVSEGNVYEMSTRNAGKLLEIKKNDENINWLRVTQESDEVYGYGYNLQFRSFSMDGGKINESLYYRVLREELITDIDNSIYFEIIGPHTYSQSKNDEVIDIKVNAFSIVYVIRYVIDNIKLLLAGGKVKNG